MEPTFNSTIEPHPTPTKSELVKEIQPMYTPPPPPMPEFPPEPIKPHRQPAMTEESWAKEPSCCVLPPSVEQDPMALFNALGAALGLGVAIGGLLVYAFSRPSVVEVLE